MANNWFTRMFDPVSDDPDNTGAYASSEGEDIRRKDKKNTHDLSVVGRLEALRKRIAPNEPIEENSSLEVKKLAKKVGYTLPAGATILDQIDGLEKYFYGSKEESKKKVDPTSIDSDLVIEMANQLGLNIVPGDSADKILEGIEKTLKLDVAVQRGKGFQARVAEVYVAIYG